MIDFLTLSTSEQKCYNYLDKLVERNVNFTINDVCENSGVSTATVNRLIKKMGYKNFKDYKSSLNKYDVKLYDYDKMLTNLINNFEPIKLERAKKMIGKANRVYFVSFGQSASLSIEATIFLNQCGYKAICINDELLLASFLETSITNDDLVFYITFSGYDVDMLRISSKLQHFCKQIVLTANTNSPMSDTCNYVLNSHFYEFDTTIRSRVSLSIILTKLLSLL